MKRSFLERLFWSPNFFTIAIRHRRENDLPIWERLQFRAEYTMSATPNHWAADPMLAEENGETYLFYEAVHRGKGRIEVVQIQENGTVGAPQVALEREYHLSYPFVFRHEGCWYMIPESCAVDEVQLFKAEEFPAKWTYVTTLLHAHAADTTVQKINGKLLLLTFLPQDGCERVIPEAYWLTMTKNGAALQKISWQEYDTLRVRGAGKLLKADEAFIRPAQVSRENSYGDAIAFFAAQPQGDAYQESYHTALLPEHISGCKYKVDGLHTYAVGSRFEVIDVRCQLFDPTKLLRKLLKR